MIDYDLTAFVTARHKQGISRADMALFAKVKEKTIVNFENGQRARSFWGRRVIAAYKNIGEFARRKGLDSPDDDEYDDLMKSPKPYERRGPRTDDDERKALHDKTWLRRQIFTIMRDNDIPALTLPASGRHVGFVVTGDQLYELGRVLLLAVGTNVE